MKVKQLTAVISVITHFSALATPNFIAQYSVITKKQRIDYKIAKKEKSIYLTRIKNKKLDKLKIKKLFYSELTRDLLKIHKQNKSQKQQCKKQITYKIHNIISGHICSNDFRLKIQHISIINKLNAKFLDYSQK